MTAVLLLFGGNGRILYAKFIKSSIGLEVPVIEETARCEPISSTSKNGHIPTPPP